MLQAHDLHVATNITIQSIKQTGKCVRLSPELTPSFENGTGFFFFEQIRGGEIPTYFSFIAIVLEFRYKIHPAYRGESTAFSCNGGEIRRLETREHKGVPPVKIRGKIS